MQKPESSLQKSRTIGNYVITKNLGEGTFGKVKLGVHSTTGQKVAIKILEKSKIIDVADVERVTRQIHILKVIRHPNLIQLYEIIQTPKQLFLIMEYVSEGELFQHIVKKKRLKQNQACQFFRQLIEGVEYLHELGIVHRDLKPENLLIDFNNRLKIVDFGLSNTYKNKELLKTACGSPCYAAPQMIAGKKYHGLNADIWSCGVILFAMVCGYLPFQDPNTTLLYKKITAGEYTVPKFVSPFARQLLLRILTTDPQKRIRIGEIKKHIWYRQPIDLSFNKTCGIKVGVHSMPIDQQVLAEVISGLDKGNEDVKKMISNNRHNHTVTIYYLLLKKHLRQGKLSKFDICSPIFEPQLLNQKTAVLQQANAQKLQEDLQEIELDRNTTATGPRMIRALSRNISNRASNASESPDVSLHNFYINKNKLNSKKVQKNEKSSIETDVYILKNPGDSFQNKDIQSFESKTINSSNNNKNGFDYNTLVQHINQPTSHRRRIYFQAPTKTILTNSIDLKSIKGVNNSEIKSERISQKSQRRTERSERMSFKQDKGLVEIPIYDIDEKRQALNRFFHQQKTAKLSIRQPVAFRTSVNRKNVSNSQNKRHQEDYNFRQSFVTPDNFGTDRYASIDISGKNTSEDRNKKTKSKDTNTIDFMNQTFGPHTNTKVPKLFGFKLQNQNAKIKSILNSTVTTGFSKRRNNIRQKAPHDVYKFEY